MAEQLLSIVASMGLHELDEVNKEHDGRQKLDMVLAENQQPARIKGSGSRRIIRSQVPIELLDDPELLAAMAVLPRNYNLEIHKTVWRVRQARAKTVALQFPEGLLMFATTVADILAKFANVSHSIILGDVTYGACCIDDYSAAALGADFLVHYGHSCLVPLDVTSVPCLYVFVDIAIDVPHLVATLKHNFEPATRLALAGTIQFATAVHAAKAELNASEYSHVLVPQAKPLSPGEVLGCTAPSLKREDADTLVFLSDGRFHLEAMMIANPWLPAYRYDPYSRTLTKESYDHAGMRAARRKAVEAAAEAKHWGVVLGTLGHQGNPRTLEHVLDRLLSRNRSFTVVLVSELSPSKLACFASAVDAWVQISCPRLSIDWGEGFNSAPLLTPFELEVALGFVGGWWGGEGGTQGGGETEEGGRCECAKAGPCCKAGSCGDRGPGDGVMNSAEDGRGAVSGCCTEAAACGSSRGGSSSSCGCRKPGVGNGEVPYPMDYYAMDGGPWNGSYMRRRAGARGGGAERPGGGHIS